MAGLIDPSSASRPTGIEQSATAGVPMRPVVKPNLAASQLGAARKADIFGIGGSQATGSAMLHTGTVLPQSPDVPASMVPPVAITPTAAAPESIDSVSKQFSNLPSSPANPNAGLPPVGTAVSHDGTGGNTNIYRTGNTFTDIPQAGQKPTDLSGGNMTVVPKAAFTNGIGTGYDPSRPVPAAGGMSGGGPVFSDPLHGEVDQWQLPGGNNAGMIRDLESRVAAGTGSNASFGDIISAKLAGRQLQNMYAARDNNYRTNAMMFDSQAGRDATLAADNNRNIFGMWKVNQDAANSTALHKMDNEARAENTKMLVAPRMMGAQDKVTAVQEHSTVNGMPVVNTAYIVPTANGPVKLTAEQYQQATAMQATRNAAAAQGATQ